MVTEGTAIELSTYCRSNLATDQELAVSSKVHLLSMRLVCLSVVLPFLCTGGGVGSWHPATGQELKRIIPARAPVEKERIETEFRSASGVVNERGKYVAGVVLITAGYSADGKYSHFFTTEVPLKASILCLRPGEYVLAYRHNENGLDVTFYEAQSGKLVGHVEAKRQSRSGKLESFHIDCTGNHGLVEIGRFDIPYEILHP